MFNVIASCAYDIGGRQVYEDRVAVQHLTTASGIELMVAIVADGVGGRDHGERAAQSTLDNLLQLLPESTETDVPTILYKAIKVVNRIVYAESQQAANPNASPSTTLVIAAITPENQLYIANVGDSRVYLCRHGKTTQLTLDHTVGNMRPIEGTMSWEEAQSSPRAHVVTRVIGLWPDVPVDLGFYAGIKEPHKAEMRGRKGLSLQAGDTIVVCSDGLIKQMADGQPYVSDEEMAEVVANQVGETAAKHLVSMAVKRKAADNVSVALLQISESQAVAVADTLVASSIPFNPSTATVEAHPRNQWPNSMKRWGMGAGIVVVLLFLLTTAVFVFNRYEPTEAGGVEATEIVNLTEATTVPVTATSTVRPTWTLPAENELGADDDLMSIETAVAPFDSLADSIYPEENCDNSDPYQMAINEGPILQPPAGTIYVIGAQEPVASIIWQITNVSGCLWENIRLHSSEGVFPAQLKVTRDGGETSSVNPGELVTLTLWFSTLADLPAQEEWLLVVDDEMGNLKQLSPALRVQIANTWIVPQTPTPMITATAVENNEGDNSNSEPQSNDSQPSATSIPASANTSTPQPAPTATPVPPTATTVPPTTEPTKRTDKPPTNTP